MKTLIAIPAMDQIFTSFAESVISLDTDMPNNRVETAFITSTLVYDARNNFSEKAIEYGYDYVLWLDSDMVFERDLLKRMFASIGDKDFMSGLYFTRRPLYKPCIFNHLSVDMREDGVGANADYFIDFPKDSVFKIDGCGFGCVLMKVEMLKKVTEQCGLPFAPMFGFGEDLSFAYKAKLCGYELWCDSSIIVGHQGQIVIDDSMFVRSAFDKK